MPRLVTLLVAAGRTLGLGLVEAANVIQVGDRATAQLNQIGTAERQRQEQIRNYACQAFPTDCGPPVEPWPGADQLIAGGAVPAPASTTPDSPSPPATAPTLTGAAISP